MTVSRRDALKLAAVAAATPLLPRGIGEAADAAAARAAGRTAAAAGRFFTAPEMALLDELVELIIPADAHSGGARAAGVAAYIDGRLAQYDASIPDLREEQEKWKAGLAIVDAAARESSGASFLAANADQRMAILTQLAAGEDNPKTDGERFFVDLKHWTAFGYYTSRIGIHDDMEYKGNTLLTEFSGTDPATLPAIPPAADPRPGKP